MQSHHHLYIGPTAYSLGATGTAKNETTLEKPTDRSISTPTSLVNNRINSLNGTISNKRASNNSIGQNNPNACYFCQRALSSHQAVLINDHYYHRECFKCSQCDKYMTENEAYRLVDHKFLCGTCFIKRKPLHSMIASINATSLSTTTTTTTTPSLQHQQHLLAPTTSTLNDLKLKFEPSNPKVYNTLLKSSHTNSHSLTNHSHTNFEQTPSISGNSHVTTSSYINSYKNNIGILQQQQSGHHHNHHPVQSSSSSSSSSNFSASLSPSSSSSWSSNNSSANMAIATSLINLNLNRFNHTSQINQRISMLNSLTARNNRNSNSESITSTIHRPLLETPSSTLKLHTPNESTNKILKRVNEINSRALNIESNSSSTPTTTNNAEKIVTTSSNFTALLANLNRSTQTTEHTSAKLAHLSSTQLSSPSDSSLLAKAIEPQPTGATASANTWINIKSHTNQCNIIQRKSRRKRSKSLPSSFNIDSLLDYLNCSMILNKHELKKLNHQRNLLMNSSSLSSYSLKNRHRHLLTGGTSSYYQHSSGYNSENHSNSSNSTSVHNFQTNSTSNLNNNCYNPGQLNFYRLSICHLPLHFVHSQCTCGAANINNSVISSVGSDLSLLTAGSNNRRLSSKVLSSSPNLKNDLEYEEEEDDEDEELDEDLDDEDMDESDLENDESNLILEQSLDISNKTTTMFNEALTGKQSSLNGSQSFTTNNKTPDVNTNVKPLKKHEIDRLVVGTTASRNRAPGTSLCQHTAKIDLRRVRSCRDLSRRQLIYSPTDFVFKEKLGEGFFANVKKIISKQNDQEMVLKELKLSCIESQASAVASTTPGDSSSVSDSTENLNQKTDFLVNYAELNAGHKSFLKEAQVLRNLNHPNVIKFMGIMFTKEKHLNLILEYISGGTLKDIIHNISNALPWKLRVGYAKDIAAALQYLHSLNIIHRDLKSDNCLVKENGTVVVADFGLSRIINNYNNSGNTNGINNNNNKATNKTQTNRNNLTDLLQNDDSITSANSMLKLQNSFISHSPQSSSATNSFIVAAKRKLKRNPPQQRKPRYAVVGNSFSMAPEMLKHQIYDERVDIFSFGIICCEIIGRVQADPDYLPRTSDFGLNVELFRKKYCEADCPKQFIKIAIACCELEPENRPPFSKTHLWLETIRSHLEANNPIPKNLLKNILDQNTKRPLSSLIFSHQPASETPKDKN